MLKLTWRTALAVPTALLLATGGALVAAGPADAATGPAPTASAPAIIAPAVAPTAATPTATAPAATTPAATTPAATTSAAPTPAAAPQPAFAVTGPASTTVQTGSTVTFTGTGTPGQTVRVSLDGTSAFSTTLPETATIRDDGTFTLVADFAGVATKGATDIVVLLQAGDGSRPPHVYQRVVFATPPTPGDPVVVLYADPYTSLPVIGTTQGTGYQLLGGAFSAGEPVSLSLTRNGAPVSYASAPGDPGPIANNGSFVERSVLFSIPPEGGTFQFTLTGTQSGRVETLTMFVLGDPSFQAAASGPAGSRTVTVSGVASPDTEIFVDLQSTAEEGDLHAPTAAEMNAALRTYGSASAPSTPNAPAALGTPIKVGADGTWSATYRVSDGSYRVLAIGALLNARGAVASTRNGTAIVSDYIVRDVTVGDGAATGTATGGTGTDGQLAFTGSQDTTPAAIAAGILMLLGTALTVVARRRRRSIEG